VGFTASLLHDIGKLVLALALSPAELSEIRDRTERKQIAGWEAEKEVIETDHAEVGAALLQSWRLPPSIVESVANHHHPVLKPKPQVSALVHVANCVAHHAKPPLGQSIHDLRMVDAMVSTFGIKDEKLDKMVLAVRENFDKVDAFMAMS
jgi:putative nucleotidyltransferase with HDIG domain